MNLAACVVLLQYCGLTLAENALQTADTGKAAGKELLCSPDLCELQRQLSIMKDNLGTLQSQLNDTKNQLEKLRSRERTKVAFSAALDRNTGPDAGDNILVYRTVITNIGNAYNNNTGIFTAPVAGVYFFTLFFRAGQENTSTLMLFKNNMAVVTTGDYSVANGADDGGNGVTLQLQQGDQVYVFLAAATHVWGGGNRYTTFSGFLLSQE
ncbi:complement C1q-like protein 3 [Myripristis murdjan]|nr:complement C1q-like protein 3 [Myripristis murdjan]